MKKFLLACLGILATVSFAACGPKASEKPKSNSPKQSQQIPRKNKVVTQMALRRKKDQLNREKNSRINNQVIAKKRRANKHNREKETIPKIKRHPIKKNQMKVIQLIGKYTG
ncbi:hypothetical protein [Enterococcus mundtii]|uniref:hypothetical protein n=1 Tax=Enterococcus mundtii TaxID=53346 RepID=UPI0003397953|nr:hypothetical protein [Enterococcus mundtii]EOU11819.1 hypothetical protein I587_00338 [Enterococcus mundtii ATCC 882]